MAATAPQSQSQPPPAEPLLGRNVLVAFDGSRGARHALACGASLSRGAHGRLTLLTVVPHPPTPAPGVVGAYDPRCIERGMVAELRGAAETVPDDIPVTTLVAHGHAPAEILRRVKQGCYDVLVLGFEGHGPMKGAWAGVCKRVMFHCPVPVLVVHAPDQ
jgi:nucleotide-binding universal stress UspA family protein